MIGKTFKYTDFDGIEREETHYFHIFEHELMDLELTTPGGFRKKLDRISKAVNIPELNETFKDLVKMSYGRKSADGRSFSKKPEYFEEFMSTEAYSQLMMSVLTDTNYAIEFLKGIMPKKLNAEQEQQLNNEIANHPALKHH